MHKSKPINNLSKQLLVLAGRFIYKLQKRRFAILLLGLMSLFLIPTSSKTGHSFQFNPLAELLLIFSIYIFFSNKSKYLKWFSLFGMVIMLRNFLPIDFDHKVRLFIALSYHMILFILVGVNLFKDLINLNRVNLQEIYGALAGYILIGCAGFFNNMILYIFTSDSFCGLKGTQSIFDQLMYFSFSTLITVGYGDVAPCNVYSAKLSMLLGMMGQFYMAIAIAMLVGGYMKSRSKNIDM